MKHLIAYRAEDQKGNVYSGQVKAKSYSKALKIAECLLENVHGLKVMSEIKLECLK